MDFLSRIERSSYEEKGNSFGIVAYVQTRLFAWRWPTKHLRVSRWKPTRFPKSRKQLAQQTPGVRRQKIKIDWTKIRVS